METEKMNSKNSDWARGEKVFPTDISTQRNCIRLAVPRQLTERRIYLYLEVLLSNTGYYRLDAEVLGMKDGTPVARFPATIADHTNNQPNESTATAFNAGGSPAENSLGVTFSNPFTNNTKSAVIQPLKISAEIDELVFDMQGLTGQAPYVRGWRAYFACLSLEE